MKKKVEGTIKDCTIFERFTKIVGILEGTSIVTSKVMRLYVEEGEFFVETLNSIYKIEGDLDVL